MRGQRRSKWTELPDEQGATYWKVRCEVEGCGFEEVKASKRNAALCQVGHQRARHYGHAWNFSVLPMKREEVADVAKNG